MPTLVIGSTAAKRHIPDWREPKDLDVFSSENLVDKCDKFWHPSFYDAFSWQSGSCRTATLDELYTIKVSHSYWVLKNGSWDKHMADIVALKQHGAQLDEGLHKTLYKVWEGLHGKKKVNLQMDKQSFFTDAVRRIYDHDSIHYSVAYGDKPIYESCFKDGQEIEMDMSKIKALPFDQQVKLFREEIYATALERWVIPSEYTFSPRKAYAWALRKTITSLTKGWSALFLVTNYGILRLPDHDYVAWHRSKADQLILLEK